jgi:hypothetical protein
LHAGARPQLTVVVRSIPCTQRPQPRHLGPSFRILKVLFIKYRPLRFWWNHLGICRVACALDFQNRGGLVHADANWLEVEPTDGSGSLILIRRPRPAPRLLANQNPSLS